MHFSYSMAMNFDIPVNNHIFELRVLPMETKAQSVYGVRIQSEPVELKESGKDGFSNRILTGRVNEQHSCLKLEVSGVAFCKEVYLKADDALQYATFTPLLEPDDALLTWHKANRIQETNPLKLAEYWMNVLSEYMTYTKNVTNPRTTSKEVFALKQGVCQDYAHLFLTLMHLEGIPCRYIAGMVEGIGETHAWCEIANEGLWIGVDPTYNGMVKNTYLKLAQGRDALDTRINRGVFIGNTVQRQTVVTKVWEG